MIRTDTNFYALWCAYLLHIVCTYTYNTENLFLGLFSQPRKWFTKRIWCPSQARPWWRKEHIVLGCFRAARSVRVKNFLLPGWPPRARGNLNTPIIWTAQAVRHVPEVCDAWHTHLHDERAKKPIRAIARDFRTRIGSPARIVQKQSTKSSTSGHAYRPSGGSVYPHKLGLTESRLAWEVRLAPSRGRQVWK